MLAAGVAAVGLLAPIVGEARCYTDSMAPPNGTICETLLVAGGALIGAGNPLPVSLQAGSAILGKVGIDQTTPGTTNGVVVNSSALPTGAMQQTGGTVGLVAGAAIIGKTGIDQTTPGTTNAVSATNFPSAVSTGTGAQGASSPRVTIATDSATVAGSASLPAGSNVIGKTGIDQAMAGITPLSALGATSLVLKASAGSFWAGYAVNRTSAPGFLVIYNAITAPAPGALTAGLVLGCVPLPPNGVASVNNKPGPPQTYGVGITELITSAANCATYTTGVITADMFGDAT